MQQVTGIGAAAPCIISSSDYTLYNFAGWQQTVGQDLAGAVKNPGFKNPAYPADDFTLSATFPTQNYNPATDF